MKSSSDIKKSILIKKFCLQLGFEVGLGKQIINKISLTTKINK